MEHGNPCFAKRGSTSGGKRRVILCCLDIGDLPLFLQFTICTVGVFLFFVSYGYMQELIFRLEGFRPFGFYLTLIQFILYSVLSSIERFLRRDTTRRTPLRTHALLSLLTVGTMGFSNASLGYLNYPTQVVFKCCKLIPVLVGGVLIQGKKYGLLDLLAAVLMSVGLSAFILTDTQISPTFSRLGVLYITGAFLMDACIGNVQEKAMKEHSTSNIEIVFFSYSMGVGLLLVLLLCSGELIAAFQFCSMHPMETYGYGTVFAIAGYFGVQFVLTLINMTGAFVTVTVTTFRKAVSIILSFMLFAKPFSFQYVWSGLMVLLGIYLHTYGKKMSAQKNRLPLVKKDLSKVGSL
ncbi:adenosine 3'-phospho 5'-phosphosulfate transporter 2 [Ixodes scapularis]|uniref:adenosine 3'-phospho 5'-phosphosulfate transporter 2 n=1 Tax=Ixodes scapularis TaxID=6945 RepID=UPI001A9F4601|nr:adenosine 3'-phospho 5'-phosphosulfate transporter 2 [Ixodes scapularis]